MKVLVCNTSYSAIEKILLSEFAGIVVESCEPAEVANHLGGVDILIPTGARIDADIISAGSFGLVQQLGVGLDAVDIDAATAAGVWVANVPAAGTGNSESVAELAILQMMVLARRLDQARKNLANGVFFKPTGIALLNKCVCIVGLGDIGKALAMRLKPFGMRIVCVREHPEHGAPAETGVEKVYGLMELNEALSQADFVVLALPETKSSHRLISASALRAMKSGAFLINVARGGIVDTDAMLQALESGHLAGAGLDVFAVEPVAPTHPIFRQNVVATPHVGGNTDESVKGVMKVIIANLKLYAEGKTPEHVVNQPSRLRKELQ